MKDAHRQSVIDIIANIGVKDDRDGLSSLTGLAHPTPCHQDEDSHQRASQLQAKMYRFHHLSPRNAPKRPNQSPNPSTVIFIVTAPSPCRRITQNPESAKGGKTVFHESLWFWRLL
jgi:hypothetical protein